MFYSIILKVLVLLIFFGCKSPKEKEEETKYFNEPHVSHIEYTNSDYEEDMSLVLTSYGEYVIRTSMILHPGLNVSGEYGDPNKIIVVGDFSAGKYYLDKDSIVFQAPARYTCQSRWENKKDRRLKYIIHDGRITIERSDLFPFFRSKVEDGKANFEIITVDRSKDYEGLTLNNEEFQFDNIFGEYGERIYVPGCITPHERDIILTVEEATSFR